MLEMRSPTARAFFWPEGAGLALRLLLVLVDPVESSGEGEAGRSWRDTARVGVWGTGSADCP